MASGTTNSFAKEMNIRKKIASIFNQREEDFPSLREYNDYLEEVEDMTVNLIEGIDVAAIEAKIEKYKRENAEQIANAEARKDEELAAALKASRGPLHTDTTDLGAGQTSHGAVGGVPAQGQYAPTAIPGTGIGQPRPTQPLPLGGYNDPLQGYPADDEEGMKLRADRVARAEGGQPSSARRGHLKKHSVAYGYKLMIIRADAKFCTLQLAFLGVYVRLCRSSYLYCHYVRIFIQILLRKLDHRLFFLR